MKTILFIIALTLNSAQLFAQRDTRTIPDTLTLERFSLRLDPIFITKAESDSLAAHKKRYHDCVLIPYHKDGKGRRVPTDSTRIQKLFRYMDSIK